MDKKILHIDMNKFYATVEQMLNPSLKGKARPNQRIACQTYNAAMKQHTTEPRGHRAVQRC